MGVFVGMKLMRVTTVASVTEQHDFSKKINESSNYELYSIATTSFVPPHTITTPQLHAISIKTCKTQQLTRTEHLPKTRPPPLTKAATTYRTR